ncbi:Methyltransferase type 12 [Rhodopirellula sp. SWK7]|nr:Methyltransferase type 12 [Rhodopirellula sp. SWK7]
MDAAQQYEDVPYPDFVHPRTNPDSIAAMARLHGVETAPPAHSRILELGCGQGGNLISLAVLYPDSHCVGIDLSAGHIASGKSNTAKLGLKNIRLHAGDLTKFPAGFPADIAKPSGENRFDYILVHGVYSWVPEQVRKEILRICRDHLSDSGIAFISYNTYPGWHAKGMVREILRHHASVSSQSRPSLQSITDGKQFLEEVANSVPETTSYGKMLREELRSISQSHEAYLFHEQFETINEPRYFHQFVDEVSEMDLQYVCESSLTFVPSQTEAMKQRISTMGALQREQYLDYVCNRTFRQSLLRRNGKGEKATDNTELSGINQLWFSTDSKCQNSDNQPYTAADLANPETELRVVNNRGTNVTIKTPTTQAALLHLASVRPAAVSFQSLWDHASRQRNAGADEESARANFGGELIQLIRFEMVRLHSDELPLVTTVSSQPQTSVLARRQAESGSTITSLRHMNVRVDEATRQLIMLCDGTNDRQQIVAGMVRFIIRDGVGLKHQGREITDPNQITELVREKIEPNLRNLGVMGLLVR